MNNFDLHTRRTLRVLAPHERAVLLLPNSNVLSSLFSHKTFEMSSQISKDADARLRFNMKVLKRHDPTIVNIVESASYVTLYQHDGEEWVRYACDNVHKY